MLLFLASCIVGAVNLSMHYRRLIWREMQSDSESEEEVVVTKEDKCHSIQGVQVRFPFTPYQCQLVYMNKVIQALQEVNKNEGKVTLV